MKKTILSASIIGLALCGILMSNGAEASNLVPYQTYYATDFSSAGYGGMRNIGTGNINLTGVSGTISDALLYWHGPSNSTATTANANVTFNGTNITGTSLGLSSDNCWGFNCSQAYRADVKSLVSGNGTYSLADFYKPAQGVNINGVSLMTFFNDVNTSNNRDVVIFNGNDSNIDNSYDASGWNITLSGINYTSGSAFLELHVSDGQSFPDDALKINGVSIAPSGPIFQGTSVPGKVNTFGNGFLWDLKRFDITSFLTPGNNSLNLTTGTNSDCLSGIVAAIDLPAGAAPEQPDTPVPEPSTMLLLGGGLAGLAFWRKRKQA